MRMAVPAMWCVALCWSGARLDAQAGRAALTQRGEDDLPAAFLRRSLVKGTGKFLKAKAIEGMRATSTPELLAKVSGGEVQEVAGAPAIVRKRPARPNMIGEGASQTCAVSVALNENVVPVGYDLKAIRLEEIVALEFYDNPSSVPLELAGTSAGESACGLFVLWMKERRRPR
jgi:hypothetical protein